MVQRHQVEDFLWLRYDQQCASHPVRAYRERAAGVKVDRQVMRQQIIYLHHFK